MRHPRRNEVYRDVGSEPHAAGDPDFIEIRTLPFEPDAALVLCSDGLSDLVPSAGIARLVARHARDPQAAVRALIAAANQAGGKDNVTALCVLGSDFAGTAGASPPRLGWAAAWTLGPAFAVLIVVAVLSRVDSLYWNVRTSAARRRLRRCSARWSARGIRSWRPSTAPRPGRRSWSSPVSIASSCACATASTWSAASRARPRCGCPRGRTPPRRPSWPTA